MESHYPSVDIGFFLSLLKDNPKVQGIIVEGSTSCYVMKGNQPVGKRMILIRACASGKGVDLDFATGTAIRINKLNELMEWLEKNRNWKDGGYFIPKNQA